LPSPLTLRRKAGKLGGNSAILQTKSRNQNGKGKGNNEENTKGERLQAPLPKKGPGGVDIRRKKLDRDRQSYLKTGTILLGKKAVKWGKCGRLAQVFDGASVNLAGSPWRIPVNKVYKTMRVKGKGGGGKISLEH